MTKKDLIWRLKELPDAVDVAELVDKKVITPEEARDLLFNNDKKNPSVENQALKEQIKFLQDTVEKLIDKLNSTNSHWYFTNTYTPSYPTTYWLASTSGALDSTMSISSSSVTFNASSETTN